MHLSALQRTVLALTCKGVADDAIAKQLGESSDNAAEQLDELFGSHEARIKTALDFVRDHYGDDVLPFDDYYAAAMAVGGCDRPQRAALAAALRYWETHGKPTLATVQELLGTDIRGVKSREDIQRKLGSGEDLGIACVRYAMAERIGLANLADYQIRTYLLIIRGLNDDAIRRQFNITPSAAAGRVYSTLTRLGKPRMVVIMDYADRHKPRIQDLSDAERFELFAFSRCSPGQIAVLAAYIAQWQKYRAHPEKTEEPTRKSVAEECGYSVDSVAQYMRRIKNCLGIKRLHHLYVLRLYYIRQLIGDDLP